MQLRVTFHPEGRAVFVSPGTSFLDAAYEAELDVQAICGRRGRCTSCRMKIIRGRVEPPTDLERQQLSEDDLREGFRLGCQVAVQEESVAHVAPLVSETSFRILVEGDSNGLAMPLDTGLTKRVVVAKAPTTEEHQTSDVEEVLATCPGISETLSLEVIRAIPAALRQERGRLTLTLDEGRLLAVEPGDTSEALYGMAFDIGTTTVVGYLLDLRTGARLSAVSGLNPQSSYGGDLMSRIKFAQDDPAGARKLHGKIIQGMNELIANACREAEVRADRIYKAVVVGNTCMHHLVLGITPLFLGQAPYAPVLRRPVSLPAHRLGLHVQREARVELLPNIAGFVGADTVAMILATQIYDAPTVRVAVDIGTNGEVVIGSRQGLMVCSAPAGPAFEGAQIKHGMRGAMGAIDQLSISDRLSYHVIGEVPPVGICGSGLIDAAAALLDAGLMDATGRLQAEPLRPVSDDVRRRIVAEGTNRRVILAFPDETGTGEAIVLTQQDIRELQLAKAAICSGILMLIKEMGLYLGDVEDLSLAGAFGTYLNRSSARRIGLIPPLPLERVRFIGNAAGFGAQLALLSRPHRKLAEDLVRSIRHVPLATNLSFMDIFTGAINFPQQINVVDAPVQA
ncbi:MAG: DUF4445 domain-containing protein [Candidatus Tectomicrobia bacterium]|nr:DUF4445 domain-containing protein [Candidatus Tectomicrobia bacterium]